MSEQDIHHQYNIVGQKDYVGSIKSIKQKNQQKWLYDFSTVKIEIQFEPAIITKIQMKYQNCVSVSFHFLQLSENIPEYQQRKGPQKDDTAIHIIKFKTRSITQKAQIIFQAKGGIEKKMGIFYILVFREKGQLKNKKLQIKNLSESQQFNKSGNKSPSHPSSVYSKTKLFSQRNKGVGKQKSPLQQYKTQSIKKDIKQPINKLKFQKSYYQLNQQQQLKRAIQESKKQQSLRKMEIQPKQIKYIDTEPQGLSKIIHQMIDQESHQTMLIQQESKHNHSPQLNKLQSQFYPLGQCKLSLIDQRKKKMLCMLTQNFKKSQQYEQNMRNIRQQNKLSRLMGLGYEKSIFSGQIMVTSGYQNPHKGKILKLGKQLGFKYQNDLIDNCYLVCRYKTTDKSRAASDFKGIKIVSLSYLQDCYTKKQKLDYKKYPVT